MGGSGGSIGEGASGREISLIAPLLPEMFGSGVGGPRESIMGAVKGDRGPLRGYYAEINNVLTTVSDIKLWSQGADTSTSARERVRGAVWWGGGGEHVDSLLIRPDSETVAYGRPHI